MCNFSKYSTNMKKKSSEDDGIDLGKDSKVAGAKLLILISHHENNETAKTCKDVIHKVGGINGPKNEQT